MLGKTDILPHAILLISVVAAVTDLFWGRIFNWLTFSAILSGFIYSVCISGSEGAMHSLFGVLLGLLLYGWIYGLKFLGGGDVKLLMGLGAWGGVHFTIEVAILAILVGGVMSLALLLVTGRILDFSKRMVEFFLAVFDKNLKPQLPKVDRKFIMPFGIAISIAALCTLTLHPLDQVLLDWGVFKWF